MQYNKPPLTINHQIALLQSRGLIIPDIQLAINYLSNIGYYRLSAYMLPLKVMGANQFLPNTTFDDVIRLYRFDRELRVFLFDYVERLEINFRTQLIYHLSLNHGAFWFENSQLFRDSVRHTSHLFNIDKEVYRARETFKDHFEAKYTASRRMPAWMAFEVASFGSLSKLYENLTASQAKREVANYFGLQINPLISWIQSLNYIRNMCAHHSRTWNRTLTVKPAYLQTSPTNLWISQTAPNDKIYYLICCILYLLRAANRNTRFITHFKNLLSRYPTLPLTEMGFPANWDSDPFWK